MCDTLITFPVRIYVTDTARPGSFYDKWYDLMPEERQERTGRFRQVADKRRSIMAYALLVHAVRDLAGDMGTKDRWDLTDSPLKIKYSQDGKPRFETIPVQFNISHAKDRVMVALSPEEVGCDVEQKKNGTLKIAKRFFTGQEYDHLLSGDDGKDTDHEFLRIWTLKESVVKCCGEGLKHSFDDFSLIDENGRYKNRVKLENQDRAYTVREYESENGYCYSCCSVYDIFEEQIRRPEI